MRILCLPAAYGLAILSSCVLFSSNARADNAAGKVQEGITAFHNHDFATALKTFEEADNMAPNDLRLAFNRGCAYAAQGEAEKAIEQYQKSAASADRKLAALSNYNLGCVAVAQAKKKFGDNPEKAEGDARTHGMARIAAAGRHFREVLLVDSQNDEARYNLETLRAWSKYIEQIWKQHDRQKQREKLDLLEYLQLLETEQRTLLAKVRELQRNTQDSPRKRQSVREAENAQRELAEEMGPLEQKIEQLAAGQGRGPDTKTSLPADAQKAVDLLKKVIEQAGKLMLAAADRLAENSLAESIEPQTSAIESIDQVFTAVAPYVNLVQRGITRQEELIELSQSNSLPKEDREGEKPKGQEKASPNRTDAAWNQRFLERYGKIIPYKARQELKQLESGQAAAAKPSSIDAPEKKEPQTTEAKDEAALKAEKQRRELKEALQLGMDLAPKVEQLARESAGLLSQEKPAEALPKQQECLKLLKEMLPKQQQQEQQQQEQEKKDQQKDQKDKDQEKTDQDKNDQQKKDQDKEKQDQKKNEEKKDRQKQDQKKKNEEKKEQEKKEQEKKEQEKKEQEKKEQEKKEQESPKDPKNSNPSEAQAAQKDQLTKEQAEEKLRRARVRQQEYKEMQKEIEGYLYRPEKVEKDW